MITITAIIRSKIGHEETMKMALLEVAQHVNENEPDTVNFYISQDINNPCVFTTYERFHQKLRWRLIMDQPRSEYFLKAKPF